VKSMQERVRGRRNRGVLGSEEQIDLLSKVVRIVRQTLSRTQKPRPQPKEDLALRIHDDAHKRQMYRGGEGARLIDSQKVHSLISDDQLECVHFEVPASLLQKVRFANRITELRRASDWCNGWRARPTVGGAQERDVTELH
jgi:hypothetical protein